MKTAATIRDRARAKRPRKRNFFSVRYDWFVRAYDAGCSIDELAAYLVMACGADQSGRISSWSIKAITERTGLGRPMAERAVEGLIRRGVIVRIRGGARPRYDLEPREPDPLSPKQEEALKTWREGGDLPQNMRPTLIRKGHVREWKGELVPVDSLKGRVWLPDSLVEGARAGDRAPVERLRLRRERLPLRLLIDLYEKQDLEKFGGVDPAALWIECKRKGAKDGREARALWFDREGPWMSQDEWPSQPYQEGGEVQPFWNALRMLEDAGLVEWVFTLTEGEQTDMPLYPVALVRKTGRVRKALENDIGFKATEAALALWNIDLRYIGVYAPDDRSFFAVAERDYTKASLWGIARMVYRAPTEKTARWEEARKSAGRDWCKAFEVMVRTLGAEVSDQEERFSSPVTST